MKNLILYIVIGLSLGSCTINSHVMLKTPKDFVFDTPPQKPKTEYTIAPNDLIILRLYSNDGFQIIDITSKGNTNNGGGFNPNNTIKYRIEEDSTCKLPILGRVKIAGKTILEAEDFLQEKYGEYYVDPFAQIQITNKRVLVFPGTGNDARVVYLQNNNTTLLEAIALAGGVSPKAKAKDIKIIRRTPAKDEIYHIDLSTIDGLKYGNMVMQGNDIIYVQPIPNIAGEALSDLAPVLSILSSTVILWLYINRIK